MSLFVGNLFVNITHDQLKEVFGNYGNCKIDLKVRLLVGGELMVEYRKSMHS
jgi:hypothetical protein